MTSETSRVRSIRLPNDLWDALQAQADALGVSLNRYIAIRLEGAKRDAKIAPVRGAPKVPRAPAKASVTVRVPIGFDAVTGEPVFRTEKVK